MPRSNLLATALLSLFALLAPALTPTTAHANETLEVNFNLAQYSDNGSWSFSLGCLANPPTSRMNYVHVTVVWIEDAAGNYITTLHRWGRTYPYNLKAWALASDMAVDGITSATPTSNGNMPAQVFRNFSTGTVDISWIPDGDYRIRIESTQCELAGEYRTGPVNLFGPEATFNFTKGRSSQTANNIGSSAPFNNVTVNYTVPGGNQPPGVWAGADQRLMPSTNPAEASTTLTAVVSDDNGTPTVAWQQVTGPTARIVSANSAQTEVNFTRSGFHSFRATATDGNGVSSSDVVEVWVNAHLLPSTHDTEVARGNASEPMGIIENSGPWVFSHGGCAPADNYSRAYYRFDLSSIPGTVTGARLRLPRGEGRPDTSFYHDFYLLTDAQDDWNGANSSTDWEASTTFNNQSVPMGLASNLNPNQLIGSWQHDGCLWRHAFGDPVPPDAPATTCPAWVEVDLDVSPATTLDSNQQWSIFVTPRQTCMNGFGFGSDENLINPTLVVIENWQLVANQDPVANAGPDRVVVDVLPSGSELVTFDGSASTDDSSIVSYAWRENGQLLGSSATPTGVTVPLGLGVHDLELTVTDGAGSTDTDDVEIIVEDRFHPNRNAASAAVIDGDPNGKTHADLFAYTQAPDGDWYAIDVAEGTDLSVDITMTGGDLDLYLYDANSTELDQSVSAASTESVGGQDLTAGRYYLQVSAAVGDASPYEMVVDVDGASLSVVLDPASAVESAGTLVGAGTVSVAQAAASALSITLASDLPAHLGFGTNPITIAAGATSAAFDIVLVDDPPGATDTNRYVNVSATAPGFNRGSSVFEVLDDEASLTATWEKATESIAETRGPLVVVAVELSGTAASAVTIPFTIQGTASPGTDFEVVGGLTQVSINGASRGTIPISIFDDEEEESAETIIIRMGTPIGANAGSVTEYTLTITDDDEAGPPPPVDGGTNDMPTEESGCGCAISNTNGSVVYVVLLLLALWPRRRRPELHLAARSNTGRSR